MGLLGNIVKGAVDKGVSSVGKGISQGITKGVSEAVGKAAETIVAPKVNNVANAAASQMDEAAKAMNESAKELNAAYAQAAASSADPQVQAAAVAAQGSHGCQAWCL